MLVSCLGERAECRAMTEAGADNNLLSLYLSLRIKPKQTRKPSIAGGGILDNM